MFIKKRFITYSVFLIILIALVFFMYYNGRKIMEIIIPFFIALIIAYLLLPLVIKLETRKLPRNVSILLIYFIFSLLTVTITIFIIPELINNSKELMITIPEIATKYQAMFDKVITIIQSSNWSDDSKNTILKEIHNSTAIAQDYMINTLKKSVSTLVKIVTMLFDLVLSMIIAYYFIKDAEFFKESVLSLVPRKWRNNLINIGRDINVILSGFIQGQLLTALIVSVMETIGLFIVRVKYPLILGLVGGVANIIPYFGPIIGAVPAIAIALIDSPMRALWTTLVFVIVQQIDNAFISPKIIEGKLGLHPVTTILAVLIGGEFFGIVGMLISVPIVAILKAISKRIIELIV